MSSRYKVRNRTIPYFVTTTVVAWVDALSRTTYKDIILDSLRYCIANKGLVVHAWVIMNNHIHLIVSVSEPNELPAVMRDLKKFTSKKIIDAIKIHPQESRKDWMVNMFAFVGTNNPKNDMYQFWQEGYHPVALDNDDKIMQRLNYLHENPVRAGVVCEAWHYKYSSATDYFENGKGLLELELLY